MNANEAAAKIRSLKGPLKFRLRSDFKLYVPIAKTQLLKALDTYAKEPVYNGASIRLDAETCDGYVFVEQGQDQ